MIYAFVKWLTSGALDRVLDTVDQRVKAQTDREALKTELIKTAYENRAGFMNAGGFWLMMAFAGPLAFWHGMVIYDTALGCSDCLLANDWTVAALPAPLDEWAGIIIVSIFGVIGADRLKGWLGRR